MCVNVLPPVKIFFFLKQTYFVCATMSSDLSELPLRHDGQVVQLLGIFERCLRSGMPLGSHWRSHLYKYRSSTCNVYGSV